MHFTLIALAAVAGSPDATDVGPLVRALWLVHRHGTPEALSPSNDQRVKGVLSKALAKDSVISLSELGAFMDPEVFDKLAGSDSKLDSAEIAQSLVAATPESRTKLIPKLREHAEYLTTTFDMIDQPHREAGARSSLDGLPLTTSRGSRFM